MVAIYTRIKPHSFNIAYAFDLRVGRESSLNRPRILSDGEGGAELIHQLGSALLVLWQVPPLQGDSHV